MHPFLQSSWLFVLVAVVTCVLCWTQMLLVFNTLSLWLLDFVPTLGFYASIAFVLIVWLALLGLCFLFDINIMIYRCACMFCKFSAFCVGRWMSSVLRWTLVLPASNTLSLLHSVSLCRFRLEPRFLCLIAPRACFGTLAHSLTMVFRFGTLVVFSRLVFTSLQHFKL